jgi:hypothetical protein
LIDLDELQRGEGQRQRAKIKKQRGEYFREESAESRVLLI